MSARSPAIASIVAFALVLAVPLAAPCGARSQDFEREQMSQGQRRAAARALFAEGNRLGDAGRWDEAVDRFRRAYALVPSGAIAFNLGSALSRVGRLVEAAELLRTAHADESVHRGIRAEAETLLERIAPRIGSLRVRLEGATDAVQVRLDGELLAPDLLDVAFPIDPGDHRLSVERDDEEVAAEPLTVGDGAAEDVTLTVPAPPEDLVPAAVARSDGGGAGGGPVDLASGRTEDEESSLLESPWFWTAVAAILVGATVVAVVLASPEDQEPFRGDFEPGLVEWP